MFTMKIYHKPTGGVLALVVESDSKPLIFSPLEALKDENKYIVSPKVYG